MRRLVVTDPALCSACCSCEVACSGTFYKRYDTELSCIRIGGASGRITVDVCDQCGTCIGVCPTEALSRNSRGIVTVDRKRCVGCMACADICPSGTVCRSWEKSYVSKCIACGRCADACPLQILSVTEE